MNSSSGRFYKHGESGYEKTESFQVAPLKTIFLLTGSNPTTGISIVLYVVNLLLTVIPFGSNAGLGAKFVVPLPPYHIRIRLCSFVGFFKINNSFSFRHERQRYIWSAQQKLIMVIKSLGYLISSVNFL